MTKIIDDKGAEDARSPGRRMGRPKGCAQSRRDAILDAALDLFIERGLGATTMGEVALRAGASKATLYKFFPDTGALLDAAIAREVDRGRDVIADALTEPDTELAITAALKAMLDALNDRAVELFRLVIAEAGRRPELGNTFYTALFAAAAEPIGNRIALHLDLDSKEASLRARQLVGAVKEPLFYPRLMAVPIDADPGPFIDRAVAIALAIEPSKEEA